MVPLQTAGLPVGHLGSRKASLLSHHTVHTAPLTAIISITDWERIRTEMTGRVPKEDIKVPMRDRLPPAEAATQGGFKDRGVSPC